MKPKLTIDLALSEGNVHSIVRKACRILEQAGQRAQAKMLREWFRTVPPLGGVSYDDVRQMVEAAGPKPSSSSLTLSTRASFRRIRMRGTFSSRSHVLRSRGGCRAASPTAPG